MILDTSAINSYVSQPKKVAQMKLGKEGRKKNWREDEKYEKISWKRCEDNDI